MKCMSHILLVNSFGEETVENRLNNMKDYKLDLFEGSHQIRSTIFNVLPVP